MNPKLQFDFTSKHNTKFTFVDICAGIGGMRIAFENLGGKCVFSSEWDKFCQITYQENFNETPFGDITKISMKNIPKHDILIAGFPCQPFSKSGLAIRAKLNRVNGMDDKEQGQIFFRLTKIIRSKKPKAVFFENVPRLLSINQGKEFQVILHEMKKLGYSCNYKVINSENVVPQRRERLYMVFIKGKTIFNFPEMPNLNTALKSILERRVEEKYTLSDNTWNWLQSHAKKHAKKGNGFGYRMANRKKTTCTLSARYGKDGSEILIPQRNKNPRKLNPRECARLMGFPDDFIIPVSDTQAYKQFGNSVVISVVYLIGYEILMSIKKTMQNRSHIQQYVK